MRLMLQGQRLVCCAGSLISLFQNICIRSSNHTHPKISNLGMNCTLSACMKYFTFKIVNGKWSGPLTVHSKCFSIAPFLLYSVSAAIGVNNSSGTDTLQGHKKHN